MGYSQLDGAALPGRRINIKPSSRGRRAQRSFYCSGARAVDNAGRTPQCVPAAQHGGELHRLLLEEAAA
jgi:hypothetical protein